MNAYVTACHADDAQKLWAWCLEGLADPARHFGPDVEPTRVRADRFYRLFAEDTTVGLGWVRRFTHSGHIMSYGKAIVPEFRGRGFSRQTSLALVAQIFEDFPGCCTLLAMIWGTNPSGWLAHPEREVARHPNVRTVGEIRRALPTGEGLTIVQITRTPIDEDQYPENEWHGAPHAQGERRL